MRTVIKLFIIAACLIVCTESRAQIFDYNASSLIGTTQCDPISCDENSGGFPVITGYYIVNFYGTCYPAYGAPSWPLTMRASVSVTNCKPPGVEAAAAVQYSTINYPEDVCPPHYYAVDYETAIAEVFSASGVVLYHNSLTEGCDGSRSGPTQIGTAPC